MHITFTKMHGLGNDFMVVDATRHSYSFTDTQIQRLGHRHFGVGFDQLLLIEPSRNDDMDFYYRIFNVDGKEAEQCGNGLRCIVKYIVDKGLATAKSLTIGTQKGLHGAKVLQDGQVQVSLGQPTAIQGQTTLQLGQHKVECFSLSLGNPHAVIQVEDIAQAPVNELGQLINEHGFFPAGVNVGFMQRVAANHIRLRVFERGVGETLACGSGACAAVLTGFLQQILSTMVTVALPGGELAITVDANNAVSMIGPAVTVYEGMISV
jgi:diaminopimelate epimerase